MTQVTLNIPDGKFEFFMELFQNLGLSTDEEFTLTKKHLEILNERRLNRMSGKSTTHSWEDVKAYAKEQYSK